MNRKRYWLIHKLSRSRYTPVPVAEVVEHDWSSANLTTADDERIALRQALIDELRQIENSKIS
jgi:hypothetical protein